MDRMIWAWAAALGFLLDWVLGDPQFLYHPVRLIGWLIGRLETVLRKICKKTEKGLLLGGLFLVAAVCGITGGAVWALLALCREVSVWLYLAVSAVLCYQLLAARSLQTESMKVYQELKKGDLPGARRAVSMIVGGIRSVFQRQASQRLRWRLWRKIPRTGSSPRFFIWPWAAPSLDGSTRP